MLRPDQRQRLAADFFAHLPWLVFGALTLLTLGSPQLPGDDLLRHAVSYAFGYSHLAMYPESTLPAFNLYPLFDHLVGWLSQQLTPSAAVKAVQALCVALSSFVFYRAAFNTLERTQAASTPSRVALDATALTLLVLGAGLMHRALLGRPEAFALLWAASALNLGGPRSILKQSLFVLAGCLVSAGYWMAWLTWPLLLLAPLAWTRRVLLGALVAAFHVSFWWWHSSGDYFTLMAQVPAWNAHRLLTVSENTTVFSLLLNPSVIALLALAIAGWRFFAERGRTLLVVLAYLVLNMVRYAGALGACAVRPASHAWQRLPLNTTHRLVVVLVALLSLVHTSFPGNPAAPSFKLPAGSRVITAFGQATFATPLANPGTVAVFPAMEVGASSHAVQALSMQLVRGKFDCDKARALKLTHAVESGYPGKVSACLHLLETQGPWRLWEVR